MESTQDQVRRVMARIQERKKNVCIDLLFPHEAACRGILTALMDPNAGRDRNFTYPVPRATGAQYYKLIKNPMFFNTINEKLNKHEYPTAVEFATDCRQVVKNCLRANPIDSMVVRQAVQISVLLEEKLATSTDLVRELSYGKDFPLTPNTGHFAAQMGKLKKEDIQLLGTIVRIFEDKPKHEKFTMQPHRLKLATRLFIDGFLKERGPQNAIDIVLPKPPLAPPLSSMGSSSSSIARPPLITNAPPPVILGHGMMGHGHQGGPPPPIVGSMPPAGGIHGQQGAPQWSHPQHTGATLQQHHHVHPVAVPQYHHHQGGYQQQPPQSFAPPLPGSVGGSGGGPLMPPSLQQAAMVEDEPPAVQPSENQYTPGYKTHPNVNRHDEYYASVSPTGVDPTGDDGDGADSNGSSQFLGYSSQEEEEGVQDDLPPGAIPPGGTEQHPRQFTSQQQEQQEVKQQLHSTPLAVGGADGGTDIVQRVSPQAANGDEEDDVFHDA